MNLLRIGDQVVNLDQLVKCSWREEEVPVEARKQLDGADITKRAFTVSLHFAGGVPVMVLEGDRARAFLAILDKEGYRTLPG